jgi:small ligand-binding sensory domain FIST
VQRFPYAHATHPQWRMATALALAQLRAQMALPGHAAAPSLGLLYITDHYVGHAQDILECFSGELPEVTDWVGTVGVGVSANNVEYFDEPALAVMLCDLSPDQYRVFSGVAPLPATASGSSFAPHTALVHADASTPDLTELIAEMAGRTASGHVFGGITSSRAECVQFALGSVGNLQGQGGVSGVFSGGLSGVAFGPDVDLIARVTQGAQPIDRERIVTAVEGNLVLALDGEPALDVLLRELKLSLDRPQQLVETLRGRLVGLTSVQPSDGEAAPRRHARGQFGTDVSVRHIIGLDPGRRGVAVAAHPAPGTRLAFSERNVNAARADLVRVCSEIREELETELAGLDMGGAFADVAPPLARQITGAVYVSCSGRGGPHFGAPSAELQIVRRALGDVPLVGFFAGGEIAHQQIYGYTGVLTVFTAPASA